MYKRIIILSVIIITALCGLGWLGYNSIQMQATGMAGARLGEFAEVAEQIRRDVKRKLDDFIRAEQKRPYTDYQFYYVPETFNLQAEAPLVRSPLAESIVNNDFAYGNFQIEPDGTVVNPYYSEDVPAQNPELAQKANVYIAQVKQNLLPVLSRNGIDSNLSMNEPIVSNLSSRADELEKIEAGAAANVPKKKSLSKSQTQSTKELQIPSFGGDNQSSQVILQKRSVMEENTARNLRYDAARQRASVQTSVAQGVGGMTPQSMDNYQQYQVQSPAQSDTESLQQAQQRDLSVPRSISAVSSEQTADRTQSPDLQQEQAALELQSQTTSAEPAQTQAVESEVSHRAGRSNPEGSQADTGTQVQFAQVSEQSQLQPRPEEDVVQIRIEPFVPIVVKMPGTEDSIFGGQVFMLRHVQIENTHLLQGFGLYEKNLLNEIKDSAQRLMREGMSFEISKTQNPDSAYTAILDFGFGTLTLNLIETDPGWILKKVGTLQKWYFSIIALVLAAVILALASLWRNAAAQVALAQKKDDFISAVSHELRTPLTSIRLYSEMLEKNWVKSPEKVTEYYRNMRQESERLSRLIENVLDFSRIQRGKKKFTFTAGDINKCVTDVVEMMMPCAQQNGFSIHTDFESKVHCTFDGDAVAQIVVNLLDNAIKYARDAADKTITVRTRKNDGFVLLEVEDHGPGIPHRQRKKVFEQFYRIGQESTRETSGSGLGLALVEKFAQSHNGFVEVLSAKPTGAIFRVALAIR